MFIVAHYLGSFFYFVSYNDHQNGLDCWISYKGLDVRQQGLVYLEALYFSIITMVTVGYGDNFPVSTHEKIFVILQACISCGVFAYCINSIGELFSEMNRKKAKFM